MMDVKRVFLYTLFFFVAFSIWNIWVQENKTDVTPATQAVTTPVTADGFVPSMAAQTPTSNATNVANLTQEQTYQAPPADID